jgi:hypothetical protein
VLRRGLQPVCLNGRPGRAHRRLGEQRDPEAGRDQRPSTLTGSDIDGSDFRRGDPRFHGADLEVTTRSS